MEGGAREGVGPRMARSRSMPSDGNRGSVLSRKNRANVKDSDGTVIFAMGTLAGGSARTADIARRHRKRWIHLPLEDMTDQAAAEHLAGFISVHRISVLNVAGSCASKEPLHCERVFSVLMAVLRSHP